MSQLDKTEREKLTMRVTTNPKISRDETAVRTPAHLISAYVEDNEPDILLEQLLRDCGPCDAPDEYWSCNVEVHTCGQ